LSEANFLLDVNVLVALADRSHIHHLTVTKWFDGNPGVRWGVCPFTEAGFLRVVTRSAPGALTVEEATEVLARLAKQSGYRFWPIMHPWSELVADLKGRIFGPQQVTDACLLGLVIREKGVLVTLDQAIGHLAGTSFAENLLVLK
jgi:uncharacterized protein